MLVNSILFVISAILAYFGASLVVNNAKKLAIGLKVSTFVIGVTVVGWGTSLPELTVGIISSIKKVNTVSFGNVIGANIIDIALIVGIVSLFFKLSSEIKLINREMFWIISSIVTLMLFLSDLYLSRVEGILFLFFMFFYLISTYSVRRDGNQHFPEIKANLLLVSFLTFLGLLMVIFGGNFLLKTAIFFSEYFKIDKMVIGLTIVSFGTTFPEFITSFVAALKKEYEISVGNILGTVIFNTLTIIGIIATITPFSVIMSSRYSLIIYLLMCCVFYIFMKTSVKITRFEGAILILLYLISLFLHLKMSADWQ